VMGDEAHGWPVWVLGHGPGSGAGVQYVENYFRYMVMDNPKWNILTANVDASLQAAADKTAADLDATSPDLSRFQAHGGKLIIYHGWNDSAVSPWNTVAYYRNVQQQMGEQQTESFLRLYMFPGMEHCGGGPGPDFVGQPGHPAQTRSGVGLLDALQDWVEQGVPPGDVIATKFAPGPGKPKVLMTRPLCPYPMVAKYKGAGNTNDAASFTCAQE
ncbi:MAG: tannase/feruloyl esterase family alpha/beta hydrolase, partial [Acidobacteriaceae bacterium]